MIEQIFFNLKVITGDLFKIKNYKNISFIYIEIFIIYYNLYNQKKCIYFSFNEINFLTENYFFKTFLAFFIRDQ